MTIWNPEYETMPRAQLRELQEQRLRWTVRWAYERVPHYRQAFEEAGVTPADIQTIEDLQRLPFISKSELREHYPYGLFAVPLDQVVRIHSSSGTTGTPVVVGYTRGDLNTWAELVARIAVAAGVERGDVAQISFGYGLFTGGFGLHYGLERVGATVIPVSAGQTERQIRIMKDFGSTVLVCTPSYAMYLGETAEAMGVKPGDLKLRIGMFGAEPWSEGMRAEIEARLGLFATDNYGLTEVMGPGVAGECRERNGMHIAEDHFIVEVIDPELGTPVEPGEVGELVFTSLTKEAFPVIRFRTRDLTRLIPEPCPCGRTFVRMEKVRGRTDDMLIVRGVNIFPSQIEQALTEIEGVEPHFQVIVDRTGSLDELEVHVEIEERFLPDAMRKLVEFEKQVEDKLAAALGIRAKVKLVEPRSIERTEGKANRVIDKRKL
jgi:phenylacetate-CoA ligase